MDKRVLFYGDEWSSDGGSSESRYPPIPKVFCYCCGNKPKKLTWQYGWSSCHYEIKGSCCGKEFNEKISYEDIRNGKADTYTVNMQ